ncbi:type 4a pilus biogenesis protein PilO [Leifsonia sp. EB34]|uniref:type 4a pilus biogenesis protein PilO n=1 Tax=Leifsonia sp. EB34 TaxID=3156303 RepID=UPI0035126CC0
MMDKNRLFMLLLGVAMAAVLAGGFLLGVRPSLETAAAAEQAREQAAASNQANQVLLNSLAQQNKKIGELTDEVGTLRQSIPSQENLSQFVDTVREAAAAQGLIVQSVTPGDEVAYAPQGATSAAASGSASSSTATPSPTPTPSPSATAATAPATGGAAQAPVPHTDPAITAANFLAVSVKVGVAGPLPATIGFVHALQNGPRLFVVNGISGGASGGAAGAAKGAVAADTYVISGYVYVLAATHAAATGSK